MSEGRSLSVMSGLASRTLRKLVRHPFFAMRPLTMPLLFFVAFTGALSGLTDTQGFTYYQYIAFEYVVILYIACVMTGIFTGFDIAGDYESGLGRRLMLATPKRMAIVMGYLVTSFGRAILAIVVVSIVGLILGLDVRANPLQFAGILVFALILNVAVTLYGAGIALRFQSSAAGTLIFIPTYIVMFMTPIFVPRAQLTGWLKVAASVNPLTPPIESGRGLMAAEPYHVLLALACCLGLLFVAAIFAVTGMRKAEKGPGARAPRQRGRGRRRRAASPSSASADSGSRRRSRGPRARRAARSS
jgi:ABC-2 type transport system permease protein